MDRKPLTDAVSVSPQISSSDFSELARQGVTLVINNRPDGEERDQPGSDELAAAAEASGIAYRHIPISSGQFGASDVAAFADALGSAKGKVHAFCRTGTRSANLWALSQSGRQSPAEIVAAGAAQGYDLNGIKARLSAAGGPTADKHAGAHHDVVIVGGGSAGLATAASILKRNRDLSVAVIEPRERHFYQPGWTMVGGGIFAKESTCRDEAAVMPRGVRWVKGAVASFQPDRNQVMLEDGSAIGYRALVVAPGNTLDWDAIDGLSATLGRNGVTSNYTYATAPYTWELVQGLKEGIALFTQPPMPIKCAGAPQKAMYLSCDHWRRTGALGNIDVAFHNAGAALFGVKDYVPALMAYVDRYGIDLEFESNLIAVDGNARRATFKEKGGEVTRDFDMLHVCPPQRSPRFVAESPLADQAGYVDVDATTMRHKRYANVFGLGDAGSTANAKTAAAARKQAPVVAVNLLAMLAGREPEAGYDGYGSCPLTVERGKIVLAEFAYGGRVTPSFPKWLIDGTRPQRLSWMLKSEALPWIYWNGMLKGREWLASPEPVADVRARAA